jgi:hypothetical protein
VGPVVGRPPPLGDQLPVQLLEAFPLGVQPGALGASETGVLLQPSATIFNLTMPVAGALIIAAAWFAHRALHRRAVTIPTSLLGIGVLGVGIFPGNIHPQHRCSPSPPSWPEGWPCSCQPR